MERKECLECGCFIDEDEEYEKTERGYVCSICKETYGQEKYKELEDRVAPPKNENAFLRLKHFFRLLLGKVV